MLKGLSLGQIINYVRENWRKLPDSRKQHNNNFKGMVHFGQKYLYKL